MCRQSPLEEQVQQAGRLLLVSGRQVPVAVRCVVAEGLPYLMTGRDTGRAMSRENVEVVRRYYEAWNADALAAIGDLCDRQGCLAGTGRGPEADLEFTRVFTLRKGRIRSIEIFRDHGEALEAVGLSE
jgi:hypothetical protein